MRTFISLNIDEITKQKLSLIQDKIKMSIYNYQNEFLNSIKWEINDKFHITLFFIGDAHVKKIKKISNLLSDFVSEINFNEFLFEAEAVNAFPKLKYPRVIILDLLNKDKKIFDLVDKLNKKMSQIGLSNDKQFHPHVTIGRVKRDHKLDLTFLKNIKIVNLNFIVKSLCLMKSERKSGGSEYSVISEYKLRARD